MENLSEKLSVLPTEPGVYLFYDSDRKIIYVGKAKNLRSRVQSYFRPNADDGRALFHLIVKTTTDIEYIVTQTEQEALVLEAVQIKAHRPRYNIQLRDDKKYPWVRITKETFPRIYPTRDFVDDGSEYLGPFSNVKSLRRSLEFMHRLFPVRTCKSPIPNKVCLEYHIKRCEGPCEGLVDARHYAGTIRQARRLLKGQCGEIIRDLRSDMDAAAQELNYEMAARFRDTINALEKMRSRQHVSLDESLNRDVVGLARDDNIACVYVTQIREGILLDKKNYILSNVLDATDAEVVSAFLTQFYLNNTFHAPEIHIPVDIPNAADLSYALALIAKTPIQVSTPKRGEKARGIELASKNAEALLIERRLKRERDQERLAAGVDALQRDASLPQPPRHIEAIDISGFHGTDKVGSLVVMVNGKPRPSAYRIFKIKTVEGSDDFASIREVVSRRFRGLIERGDSLPDLLLIDGGKGQLSSAVAALKDLGLDSMPALGLAKRLEELFQPGISSALVLPKTSAALRMLQHLRDEAHRFAVKHHRTQRTNRTINSALTEIDGIGKNRATQLLRHFGSTKRIAESTAAEIAELQGFSLELAQRVLSQLAQQ